MEKSRGFSLVELMVAMVVGLIIILGAGQLFLTVFQTNRQVETLGEKQAAINFAVETLLRDVRRADWPQTSPAPDGSSMSTLKVTVPNRGDCSGGESVEKIYSLASRTVVGDTKYFLEVGCDGGASQEIVGGFSANGFSVEPVGNYGVLISFTLVPTDESGGVPESLEFFAVNRTAAVDGSDNGDDGLDEVVDGLDEVVDGLDEVVDGLDEVVDGLGEVVDGTDEVIDGTDEVIDGTDEIIDGIDQSPTTCESSIEVTGSLIQNASQDSVPSLYLNGEPQGECVFEGNKSYSCVIPQGAPLNGAVRVELITKEGKKQEEKDAHYYSVDDLCQASDG